MKVVKKQFNWNLISRYTVKLTLNYYFINTLKEKFHSVSFPLDEALLLYIKILQKVDRNIVLIP